LIESEKELKKSQKIPDSVLEKIIQKIKSHIIYNMAIIFDRTHIYDENEFSKKNDDSLVHDNDSSTEMSQTSMHINTEESKENKENKESKESKESRIIKFQSTLKKNFQDINKDPKKIAEDLIKIELQVIRSFGVSNEDYFNSLMIAIQTNKKIQKDLQFLAKYKQHFENDELMSINFGKIIKDNFLKIVSNIYYLNLREVSRLLKFEYFDKGVKFNNESETNKTIYHLYEKNLKKTR